MPNHVVGYSYRTDAGTIINISETLTGVRDGAIDAVIATEVQQEFDVAVSIATVQSLMILLRSTGHSPDQ